MRRGRKATGPILDSGVVEVSGRFKGWRILVEGPANMWRKRTRVNPFEHYRHLRLAKDYVDAHLSEPISLDDVARQANLSRTHFSRIFYQQTGIRFRDWLVQQRIDHAKELLCLGDRPITEIAFRAGFGSISTFERAFKKLEGETPRSFRGSNRKRSLASHE